jgi:autotransporter-associated beta strand protein
MPTWNEQEERLFCETLKHTDASSRARFLEHACAGNPALKLRLEALLGDLEQADRFFSEASGADIAPARPSSVPPAKPLVAMLLGLSLSAQAASLTLSTSAPTPGTNDVYNFTGAGRDAQNVSDGSSYADGAANDAFTYVAGDRPSQGQTFTTGTNPDGYTLKSVWLRHAGYTTNTALTYWQMNSGVTLTVRISDPAQAGTSAFALDAETYATTGSEGWSGGHSSTNGSGNWLQFTFTSPVTLAASKTYGFDITSGSTGAFFEWLGTSNTVYSGGGAYSGSSSGTTDNTLNARIGDRVFLVALASGTNTAASNASTPPTLAAVPFDLTNVTLLPSPFLTNMLMDKAYLLSLNADSLLYNYRANVGLSTSNAAALGGWETPGSKLCIGHYLGHYLSACSMMYQSTNDPQLKARTDYLVAELAKCQAASPAAGYSTNYLAAFPESWIDDLINQTQSSYFSVPWYNIHKLMAGLIDTYQLTRNTQALMVATNLANWVQYRMDQLTSSNIQAMLNYREYGGMNESLANLYGLTGNTNYLRVAANFDKQSLFTPLSLDQDILDGLHANTQIPEIIGAAREYELTGTGSYQEIASFFWKRVANYRSYAIGGNSESEYFFPVTAFPSHLTGQTCETCNTYNMLKLTRHLFEWAPSAAAMDYYERALYNQILGSEAAPGAMTYFVSLLSGHFKTYSTSNNSFWCCDGTGVENHAKYGDTIFFHGSNSLYLNLFIPARLAWPEKNLTVTQATAFPQSDTTTLTLQCTNGLPLTLNLRYPSWALSGMQLAINGVSQTVTNTPGSYVSITRNWQTNDQVQIRFPMTLRTESLPNTSNTVAVFYGPILLAGALGTNGMPASDIAANQGDLLGVSIPAGTVPALVTDAATLLSNTVPVAGQPLAFQTRGAGRPNDVTLIPFYQVMHQRYSVYWSLITPSATCVWSGGGTSANWSVSANWSQTPTNQCQVEFGSAAGGTTTNDLAAGTQINGIQFLAGAGAFALNGNSIALQGDVVNSSSAAQQINLPLQLTGGIAWKFDPGAGSLALGGPVTGSGSISKLGEGTLTALSNFTFTGTLLVSNGLMQFGNGGASGSLGSLQATVAFGASLALNRGDTFQMAGTIYGAGSYIKRGAGTLQLTGVLSNTGPTIVESGRLQIATQAVTALKHRWSFNGSLSDSFGTNNAVVVNVGTNNASLTSGGITLAGGSKSTSDYVSLGSGLLPKDGTPATIELWATQLSAQSWSRLFDIGSSSSENLFMCWSQGTDTTQERVEWRDSTTSTSNNSCAPYALGTEYHIALVIEPGAGASGGTKASWYSAPSANASLGSLRGSFETANTLTDLNDTNFWLGRSEYADATANASYNEVRLWHRAFSPAELQQLHTLGAESIGAFGTNFLTGSLSAQSELRLLAGAQLDLSGSSQAIAALAGDAGSTVQLNGGHLVIRGSTNTSGVFAGSLTGTGSVVVEGALRLSGDAAISGTLALTNNGLLDVMTWSGTLPAGFVNHGTILDRTLLRIQAATLQTNAFNLVIQGHTGHTYQLQTRDNLETGSWQNLGSPQSGSNAPLTFNQAVTAEAVQRFYRIAVWP